MYALHNLAVDNVDLFIVAAADFATETNDAHHNRRGQFEPFVLSNPIGKEFGQAQVITDACRESSSAERAPYDPRLERAKTAAEVHSIIHVIDLGTDWIAEMHVLRRKCKQTTQTSNIAHVERTEIQRHKKHFVRIDDDRICFAPSRGEPLAFG